jgi:hypothetical protein
VIVEIATGMRTEVCHARSAARLTARGELSDERAADTRTDFGELAVVRYPHVGLSERTWELRHYLTAYDAAIVALAESLNVSHPFTASSRRRKDSLCSSRVAYEQQRPRRLPGELLGHGTDARVVRAARSMPPDDEHVEAALLEVAGERVGGIAGLHDLM